MESMSKILIAVAPVIFAFASPVRETQVDNTKIILKTSEGVADPYPNSTPTPTVFKQAVRVIRKEKIRDQEKNREKEALIVP